MKKIKLIAVVLTLSVSTISFSQDTLVIAKKIFYKKLPIKICKLKLPKKLYIGTGRLPTIECALFT